MGDYLGWPGCLFAKAEGLKNKFFVLLDRIGAVFPRLIFHNMIMSCRTLEAGILALNLEHRPNYAPRLPSSRLIPPDQMTRSQKAKMAAEEYRTIWRCKWNGIRGCFYEST